MAQSIDFNPNMEMKGRIELTNSIRTLALPCLLLKGYTFDYIRFRALSMQVAGGIQQTKDGCGAHMANTQKYLAHLLQDEKITPACSEEERVAAQELAGIFKDHGFNPEIQEFDAGPSKQVGLSIMGIMAFVGAVLCGLSGVAGVIGYMLLIAAVVLYVFDRLGHPTLTLLGAGGPSQNVIAYHKATGPVASPRNRPVVVVAHYDSPRADFASHPSFGPYVSLVNRAFPYAMVLSAVAAIVHVFPIPEAAQLAFWILAIVFALVALAYAVIQLAHIYVLPYTSGAVCNKSSVAAMLGIMDTVAPLADKDAEMFPDDVPADAYFKQLAEEAERAAQEQYVPEDVEAPAARVKKHVFGGIGNPLGSTADDGENVPETEDGDSQATSAAQASPETGSAAASVDPFVTIPDMPEVDSMRKEDQAETGSADSGEPVEYKTFSERVSAELASEAHASVSPQPSAPAQANMLAPEPEYIEVTPLKNEAGCIRYGAEKIAALGMLPTSCDIEYTSDAMPRPYKLLVEKPEPVSAPVVEPVASAATTSPAVAVAPAAAAAASAVSEVASAATSVPAAAATPAANASAVPEPEALSRPDSAMPMAPSPANVPAPEVQPQPTPAEQPAQPTVAAFEQSEQVAGSESAAVEMSAPAPAQLVNDAAASAISETPAEPFEVAGVVDSDNAGIAEANLDENAQQTLEPETSESQEDVEGEEGFYPVSDASEPVHQEDDELGGADSSLESTSVMQVLESEDNNQIEVEESGQEPPAYQKTSYSLDEDEQSDHPLSKIPVDDIKAKAKAIADRAVEIFHMVVEKVKAWIEQFKEARAAEQAQLKERDVEAEDDMFARVSDEEHAVDASDADGLADADDTVAEDAVEEGIDLDLDTDTDVDAASDDIEADDNIAAAPACVDTEGEGSEGEGPDAASVESSDVADDSSVSDEAVDTFDSVEPGATVQLSVDDISAREEQGEDVIDADVDVPGATQVFESIADESEAVEPTVGAEPISNVADDAENEQVATEDMDAPVFVDESDSDGVNDELVEAVEVSEPESATEHSASNDAEFEVEHAALDADFATEPTSKPSVPDATLSVDMTPLVDAGVDAAKGERIETESVDRAEEAFSNEELQKPKKFSTQIFEMPNLDNQFDEAEEEEDEDEEPLVSITDSIDSLMSQIASRIKKKSKGSKRGLRLGSKKTDPGRTIQSPIPVMRAIEPREDEDQHEMEEPQVQVPESSTESSSPITSIPDPAAVNPLRSIPDPALPSIDRANNNSRAALFDLPDPMDPVSDPFATQPAARSVDSESPSLSETAPQHVTSQFDTIAADDVDNDEYEPAPTRPRTKKKHHFFGRKKKTENSMSDWLGVDDEFDAKQSGRDIGSWDNFEDDDWKGGAAAGEGVSEEEKRQAVTALGNDELLGHDIWFVATGASECDSAGMKAFLATHHDKLRGVFFINLESIGSGDLATISVEGDRRQLRGDRRISHLVHTVGDALHYDIGNVPMPNTATDAYAALDMSLRALTIAGVEGNRFACAKTTDDYPFNVEPDNVLAVAEVVTELIRRS